MAITVFLRSNPGRSDVVVRLHPRDRIEGDAPIFGYALASSGDRLMVGARLIGGAIGFEEYFLDEQPNGRSTVELVHSWTERSPRSFEGDDPYWIGFEPGIGLATFDRRDRSTFRKIEIGRDLIEVSIVTLAGEKAPMAVAYGLGPDDSTGTLTFVPFGSGHDADGPLRRWTIPGIPIANGSDGRQVDVLAGGLDDELLLVRGNELARLDPETADESGRTILADAVLRPFQRAIERFGSSLVLCDSNDGQTFTLRRYSLSSIDEGTAVQPDWSLELGSLDSRPAIAASESRLAVLRSWTAPIELFDIETGVLFKRPYLGEFRDEGHGDQVLTFLGRDHLAVRYYERHFLASGWGVAIVRLPR